MPRGRDDLLRLQRKGPDDSDARGLDARLRVKRHYPLDSPRERDTSGQRQQLLCTSRPAPSPQLAKHRLAKLRPEIEIALVVQHVCKQTLLFRSFHTLKT